MRRELRQKQLGVREKGRECEGEVVDRGRRGGESEGERKGRRYELNLVFLVWFD